LEAFGKDEPLRCKILRFSRHLKKITLLTYEIVHFLISAAINCRSTFFSGN